MLLFPLLVHVAAVLGILAFRPRAQEVVVALGYASDAFDGADDVQVEGEVVPERLGEHDAVFVEVGSSVQLVPRRVQQLRVE